MTGVKTRIGTRKSVTEKTITPPKSRRRSSIENGSSVKKTRYSFDPSKLSPTALIKKLDTVSKDELLHGHSDGSAAVELKGLGDDLISTEDYEKMRENVRQKVSNPENFDSSGKTEINTAGAVLAGAKMVIDEVRSTRSMCKKLKEDCGVEEDEVLYQPLSYLGAVNKTCQEIMENRQASVAELYVDYKKQLSFKSNVLEHVVSKQVKKGSKTENRGLRVKNQLPPPMTPANGIVINPLDVEKIISNYALEVASTVRENRKPRRIAPIPFDINCLDDEDDE